MPHARIVKRPADLVVAPNLRDYERARRTFTWEAARAELDGLPAGAGLNIAHEAVDRHGGGPRAAHVALRCLGQDGGVRTVTYGELRALSNRFANALCGLGVGPGARVFALMPRVPELYVAAFGALKAQAVFCPLYSAYGPEPIRERLALGDASVLITTARLYARKVAPIRDHLPALTHVLVVGGEPPADTRPLHPLLEAASNEFTIAPTDPETPALLHFTSGTTGRPKGAVHVHEAVVCHHASARYALDLHRTDVFWCTADPGWVTGTSYGIVAPLTVGATLVIDEAEFDAERWLRILRDEGVTVWYTAPTAVRMLMRLGAARVRAEPPRALRLLASVGEPLNAEAVCWGRDAFGMPFHDNWWQTETGAIMIANFAAMDIKPGSMGRPLPGIEASIVRRREDGTVIQVTEPDAEGQLVLRAGWPSMFRAYLNDPERYAACFADGWYLTGDLARRDAEGYFWFLGRADDVIKSAGHLIGPTEVERVLLEHEAVIEAGVIGIPDPTVGETVKAFVSLRPGTAPSEALRRDILAHARRRLGPAVAPREIAFDDRLPKTRSGKIMRRLLKARELGLPAGDLSALEEGG